MKNYQCPNPFQHYLILSYDLETAQQIDVLLYDLNGRKVQTLWFNEFRNDGSYHERIRVASNLYPGQYFMIFKAGKRKQILRLIKQ
jgi:hypothetical protein